MLRGMTWDHPRGFDPLAACAQLWRELTGVEIVWDKRSLQDFESYPVLDLARRYDLIVIDHPHIGQVTDEHCLAPLDVAGYRREREELARGSVGPSWRSYSWNGRQWALPIDAATLVQAWRADLIAAPVRRWDEVIDLARRGLVRCPMLPPHSLMVLFTLTANLGRPCDPTRPEFFEPTTAATAVDAMRELIELTGDACFEMDPIAISEEMAKPNTNVACVPFIYGYANYAREGFRPRRLRFADIPVIGTRGPVGSALGGTGLAVSAYGSHVSDAIRFAYWVASAPVQSGPYAAAGGQPGHAAAWEDQSVNAPVAGFYEATRATIEGAWLRPRYNGYMGFQKAASERLNQGLKAGESGHSIVAALNALFRANLGNEGTATRQESRLPSTSEAT